MSTLPPSWMYPLIIDRSSPETTEKFWGYTRAETIDRDGPGCSSQMMTQSIAIGSRKFDISRKWSCLGGNAIYLQYWQFPISRSITDGLNRVSAIPEMPRLEQPNFMEVSINLSSSSVNRRFLLVLRSVYMEPATTDWKWLSVIPCEVARCQSFWNTILLLGSNARSVHTTCE